MRAAEGVVVGDEAVNARRRGIEDSALRVIATRAPMAGEPLSKPSVDLPRMAEIVRRMQADAVTSCIAADPAPARRTSEQDDEVDALCNQTCRERLTSTVADPGTINRAAHPRWTARNHERVANNCERV